MTKVLNCIEYYLRLPKVVIGLSFAVLLYYLSPFLVYGQDLYISAYDNLDITVPMSKILAHSGLMFGDSNAIIPNMMGGLPRHTYGSEFNVMVWLYYFFSPFTAYVINEVIMHLVAFGSMWLLLSRHVFLPTRQNMIIIATGSLYFALIPYWGGGGISVPSIPLVVYALLNIRAKHASWKDWAILILIPFYTSFVLVYFFVLLLAGIFWLIDSIRKREWQWHFLGAIVLMVSIYLMVEYRLVYATFMNHDFISHRTEFAVIFVNSALECYRSSMLNFLNGSAWVKGNHFLFLLPLSVLAFLVSLRTYRFNRVETLIILLLFALAFAVEVWGTMFGSKYFAPAALVLLVSYIFLKRQEGRALAYSLIAIFLIALEGGFWFYEGLKSLDARFPFMHSFNMSRFAFIEPVLWAMVAAYAVSIIQKRLRYSAIVTYLFVMGIVYVAIHNSLFRFEEKNTKTYRNYYAEPIFSKIRDYIGKPQENYRVASLGIEPAVALYNGFYTIDGYSPNYPLEYKHRFERIFEKERPKSPFIDGLFRDWGSKCYIFTRAVAYEQPNTEMNLRNIELNATALRALGAEYIFTPVRIPDPQKELKFCQSFTADDLERMVFVYRIMPNQ